LFPLPGFLVLLLFLFDCRPGDLVGAGFIMMIFVPGGIEGFFLNFLGVLGDIIIYAHRQLFYRIVWHFVLLS
jgi:hypothetical protein